MRLRRDRAGAAVLRPWKAMQRNMAIQIKMPGESDVFAADEPG